MATLLVGLGEIASSSEPGDTIKAVALGSCVGLVVTTLGGSTVAMAHIVLPESKTDPALCARAPGYFADTAVDALIASMLVSGAFPQDPLRWLVKLTGGARMPAAGGGIDIGRRNILAIKKTLSAHGLGAASEDLGGTRSRTVSVAVGNDVVRVVQGDGQVLHL